MIESTPARSFNYDGYNNDFEKLKNVSAEEALQALASMILYQFSSISQPEDLLKAEVIAMVEVLVAKAKLSPGNKVIGNI